MNARRWAAPMTLAGALFAGLAGAADAPFVPPGSMAPAARSAPISLQGAGPYHRLALPLAIHGHAADADLRDLRVRNAAGHAVPYAWLNTEATAPQTDSREVPIFALPATEATAPGDAAPAITVRPDGSLALDAKRLAAQPAPSSASSWLIDLRSVPGSLLQARFQIAPDARGLFAFRLEASDDLRRWRALGGEEQLVRLSQGGQTIERLAVDLHPLRAQFLRLRWSNPTQGVRLLGVGVDSLRTTEPAVPLEWSDALKPERCEANACDYRLPRGLPLQGLRIDLAEVNTLARVEILGQIEPATTAAPTPPRRPVLINPLYELRHRHRLQRAATEATAPHDVLLLDTVVYRLTQGAAEARSPVLALDGAAYARLRLRTAGPVTLLGATPPTIAVAALPRTLVFLAQGAAPFSLSWGDAPTAGAAPPGATLPLGTLIPGHAQGQPIVASEARVVLPALAATAPAAGAAASAVAVQKPASKQPWLWAALGAGLLLLAGMAWSLLAALRKNKDAA